MPARNPDLHGSAPDKAVVALLIVDVINDLGFPEAKQCVSCRRCRARFASRRSRLKLRRQGPQEHAAVAGGQTLSGDLAGPNVDPGSVRLYTSTEWDWPRPATAAI